MKIDISICVITYNHELYIRDTLRSINEQVFDGTVQIIIGVDVSEDRTLEIVEEMHAKIKWPVTIIEAKNRKGMFVNLEDVLQNAKGDYIAVLEGDDYWLVKNKLSKQFNYLKDNVDCIGCGGKILTQFNSEIKTNSSIFNLISQRYFFDDFIHSNRVSFCTVMFKRSFFNLEQFQLLKDSPHLDWPIYLLLFQNNQKYYFKVFSDVFSMYRLHAGGVYSMVSKSNRKKNVIKTISFNKLMINTRAYDSYYNFFERNQNSQVKQIPSINELLKVYKIKKKSLLSFYIHNYGSAMFFKVFMQNLSKAPLFIWLLILKLFRRYLFI